MKQEQQTPHEAADGQVKRLDELLDEVESCIRQLEDPDIPLEDAFRYYEAGVGMLRRCHEKVSALAQKMQVITAQGTLEDF